MFSKVKVYVSPQYVNVDDYRLTVLYIYYFERLELESQHGALGLIWVAIGYLYRTVHVYF